jgi:fatty-acyl-CoA synthase
LKEFDNNDLPFLKRIFQLPTGSNFESDLDKIGASVSTAVMEKEFYNNFHDWLIYRTPSDAGLQKVDRNIENQRNTDITNIQFTSGTTGLPKAASLTHRNLVNNAIDMKDVMEMSTNDKMCVMVPFYHCMGMVCGNLTAMTGGSAIVIPWPTFNARKSLETIIKYNCTATIGVPTMFYEMIKLVQSETFKLKDLHKCLIAGSICPKQLIMDMENHLGLTRTHIAYGMTETSPISFMIRTNHPLEKKSTTVGTIMSNTEAKIVSPDGKPVPIGEKGEYAVKGYLVMPGYYNDPDNTRKSIVDGWMMTGDLARFDEEGFMYIEGRLKDLIIRGGENISPKEIEEYIMEIPEVDMVQVIGVPDPKFQEEICAVVKVKQGQSLTKEGVKEFLKPRISHFKIPKYVKFADGFPITVTGKLRKVEMISDWVKETQEMSEQEIREKYMIR